MNAALLLQHFDRIGEAPDAVARLRRFILDLAVRGKLVEQDPNDEPAAELLERIQAKKARLVRNGKLKKEKPLPAIAEEDRRYELPRGWHWVRLGDLSYLITSGSRDWAKFYSDNGAIFLRMGNLSRGSYRLRLDSIQRVQPPQDGEGARTKLEAGDILISITGEVGLLGLIPSDFGEAYINQHTCLVRPTPLLDTRYLPELFRSPFAQDQFNEPQRGIKNSFRLTDVTEFIVPLPPLAEQHRIVAKVDELMALCDQLEAARNEREVWRDRLVAASLHRIGTTTADEGKDTARFHLDHLSRLTTRPEHIKQLRQTILNLAVRGRLVPQNPNDEPAAVLLKHIGSKISDDAPFLIPNSWTWVSVDQIGDARLGKMLDKAKNKGTPRPYLRNVNVRWFNFDLSDVYEMPFEDDEIHEFALRRGDVLICEGGEPGRAAVWDDREKGIYFQKAIHRVRFAEGVNSYFFVNALRESADSGRLSTYFTGVGIKHFTGKGLASFVFPLPPLAEQHRIVAKVDKLMALCDQLETQLTATEADSRRLLEAVLREALA
jgi:type I restriction enzyme S subunit